MPHCLTGRIRRLWDRNIRENPDEPMWPVWRERFARRIALGQAITFAVILDGDPVVKPRWS